MWLRRVNPRAIARRGARPEWAQGVAAVLPVQRARGRLGSTSISRGCAYPKPGMALAHNGGEAPGAALPVLAGCSWLAQGQWQSRDCPWRSTA